MARLPLAWTQIVAAVGALQGVLLIGALLAHRGNRTANRLLAVLMATFTIYLAWTVYYAAGLVRVYPHLFGVSYLTPYVFGPLVYLYALAASDRSWRFRRQHLIHFVPAAIAFVLALPYYAASGAEKIAFYEDWSRHGVPAPLSYVDPFKYVSGIGYSIATVLYLRRHARRIEDSYSNKARVNLRWLTLLTASAGIIWAMAVTLRVAEVRSAIRDEHISLAIAVLIYATGYLGLRQPEVFRYETAEYPVQLAVVPKQAPVVEPPEKVDESEARYDRSGLSDIEARRLKDALLGIMDAQQPWKESELTLADLAARLDSTPHKVSEVLNSGIGQTFYDFVNGYRVREVQRRIQAGDARHLKILALALDAGFASKSTFNEAFKRHTNQTPSEFRQAVGA
jgi:AraC-like DNA-binding protein